LTHGAYGSGADAVPNLLTYQIAVDLSDAVYDALAAEAAKKLVGVESLARDVLTEWAGRKSQ
jgi:hypothetical protein